MKKNNIFPFCIKNCKAFPLIFLFLFVFGNANAKDEAERYRPKLRLSYFKYMSDGSELLANAYYRLDGENTPCVGATVGLYTDEDFNDMQTEAIVDDEGFAKFEFDKTDLRTFQDSIGHFMFYARLEENEKFKERDADLFIRDADLKVEFLEIDSVYIVKASIYCADDSSGEMMPRDRTPLKCYVERAFSPLPVGEDLNYTNDDGFVEIVFPNDIPGDKNGVLKVIVKLDDYNDFGTVIDKSGINWGTQPDHHADSLEAPLAGSTKEAPLFMKIGIIGTIVVIWGFILHIFLSLFKIRRLGKL